VYAHPALYGALDSWAAVLGFSGQIYFDFAGYSLCAIGLALCFGYAFPDNFRFPYAARGFSDFWQRWHMSLSSWLRDYLYIPLGGNRRGRARTYLNLLLTMLIGGLWHGASWMFVLWGGLHGSYLALERVWRERSPVPSQTAWRLACGVLLTFLVVTLTWIPFRAAEPGVALAMLRALFTFETGSMLPIGDLALCLLAAAAMLRWQFALRAHTLEESFAAMPAGVRMFVLGGCLIAMFLCSGGDERAFIYFQF
jgi:D-alanyl-lipoteichoic acid acyltransferase DltB (MBOAT superfamily)